MHVPTNEIVMRGLSMPHSPRWYRDKLWLLESGEGTLSVIDTAAGTSEVVARAPGFTRGISFYKNLAFVGLSQVRESAMFNGLGIIERYPERTCGVWILDINTGKTLGNLTFTSGIQELFAVELVPKLNVAILDNDDDHLLNTYVFDSIDSTSP